jgi:hypothetical protein
MANLPVWNQLSGHTLATLEERVTAIVNLPLDPSSADIITGFKPDLTPLSRLALPTLTNSTDLGITKTWSQEPSGHTYPVAIRIPTIPALTDKKLPVAILLHGDSGTGSNEITTWENYLGDHILIAPTGYNNTWNIATETSKAPDIDMLKDLITALKGFNNVDEGKIKFVGFDTGAGMVNRTLIEINDPNIDSYVTIGSQLFDPQYRNDTFFFPSTQTGPGHNDYNTATIPLQDKKMLILNGTTDATIPYNGGVAGASPGVNFLSAQDSAFALAKSQGYTGSIIPDAGGVFYGTNNTYYYSYLGGRVTHYKTDTGHTVETFMQEIVQAFMTYAMNSLPDIYLEAGSITTIDLNTSIISLISGTLPPGLRLVENQIIGTPFEVQRSTTFEFVLRATNSSGIADRTFNIIVNGPDVPVWTTNEGRLPIGPNNSFYIIDSSIVDFQLSAIDPDLPAGDKLEYYIADGDGTLPPGIKLTEEGRLIGIVDPILALDLASGSGFYDTTQFDSFPFDFGLRSANGYQSYFYDTTGYDYAIETRSPKKLNRFFEFKVSVSDGDTVVVRKFIIFLVGDDFLRADNTIMQIGTGIFTADNTFLRTPVWLTPGNIGYKRANNFVTIYLDVFDPNTIVGELNYSLEQYNDDASPSVLPPGMALDVKTGEIAGRVPYQPAITKEYKFTIDARRFTDQAVVLASKKKTFTVKILGEIESSIIWETMPDLGSIKANFISTFSVKARIINQSISSKVLYRITAGELPPGLKLNPNGEIIGKVNQFRNLNIAGEWQKGLTTIDNNLLLLDGSTTTIDRKFKFTVEARDRFGFSALTAEYNIIVKDPDNISYSNLYVKPFMKTSQRTVYNNFISDPNIFDPDKIYRPDDPAFGLQKEIKMLIYAGVETKDIKEYVAVSRKHHSRKRFKLGAVKTATAKTAGTNTIEYEVVYLEVIDPYDSTGTTDVKTTLDIKTKNKLTVDSVEYESFDDVTKEGAGVSIFTIINSLGQTIQILALGNDLEIVTRNSGTVILDANGTIVVELQNGSEVISGTIATTTSDPFRWRPRFTPIKTDSDAVQISDAFNTKRYVSNVTNMRDNIKTVGLTERDFLPLWMTTAQSTSVQELGYVTAIPLCFCKPGESATIALNIANSEFNFRTLDFEIDRYIIDATTGNSYEQYIPFGNYAFNV